MTPYDMYGIIRDMDSQAERGQAVMTTDGTSGMPFADRLRLAREVRGDSQARAARSMGVSVSAVCKWEQGINEPRIDTLQRKAALEYIDRANQQA